MFQRVTEKSFYNLLREQDLYFSENRERFSFFAPLSAGECPCESEIMQAIDAFAPWQVAEAWDPCGLQIGYKTRTVHEMTVTLDLNSQLWTEPQISASELILAHHPVFFSPVQTLLNEAGESGNVYQLIRQNQSFISAHTNLDQAIFGTSFAILRTLFPELLPEEIIQSSRVICPDADWPDLGHGRLFTLETALPLEALHRSAKEQFQVPDAPVRPALAADLKGLIDWLAIFPGSFDLEMSQKLPETGRGLIVTGEAKYHEQVALYERRRALICLGHDVSERVAMPVLTAYLRLCFPAVAFAIDRGIDYTLGMAN